MEPTSFTSESFVTLSNSIEPSIEPIMDSWLDAENDRINKVLAEKEREKDEDAEARKIKKAARLAEFVSPLQFENQTHNMENSQAPVEIEFLRQGNFIFLNEKSSPPPSMERIPAGTYLVRHHPLKGFYLEGTKNFYESGKVYGNLGQYTDRILNTYDKKAGNTGVILAGTKGSGKTKLARLICEKAVAQGMPVLIVNSAFGGDSWLQFLNQIEQRCVILLDEFEKVYDADDQPGLLTLLDGVFISKKLFLLTCNDKYKIDSHFRNRPGRIHYLIDFSGMDRDSVKQYCEENVKDPERAKSVFKVSSLYSNLSFDVLKALVWEVNTYPESSISSILEILNARSDSKTVVHHAYRVIHKTLGELVDSNTSGASPQTILFDPLVEKTYSFQFSMNRKRLLEFMKAEGKDFTDTYKYSLLPYTNEETAEGLEEDELLRQFIAGTGVFAKTAKNENKFYFVNLTFDSKNIIGMDEKTGELIIKTNLWNLEVRLKKQEIVAQHYWSDW